MATFVEIPEPSSKNDDAPKNNANNDDTALVLPASSPVASDASSQHDDHEKENHNAIATCLDGTNPASSPTKKRRVHSHHQQQWNVFCRQGTSLKGLLGDVLQLATTTTGTTTAAISTDEDTATMEMRPLPSAQQEHAADLARAKTRECMILEKKLKEAEAHAASMTATNVSLRESAASTNERMERTVQALQIASQGAANARADADAAEACAASMATQLQALRTVVEETKRASTILYQEQEQVAAGARSMEANLLQRETELARAKKLERQWKLEKEEMTRAAKKMQTKHNALQQEAQHVTHELHTLQHESDQHNAIEQARKDRAAMVEQELRQARTMLQDATSTAAENEATTQVLQDAIQQVEHENKTLSEAMEQLQAKARQDNERLQESLGKAEKEAQSLRVKAASHEQDLQRIRMDRAASEKEVSKLKTKVSLLERRLKDATTSLPYTTLEDAASDTHRAGDTSTSRASSSRSSSSTSGSVSFSIPPLTTPATSSSSKFNNNNKEHGTTNRVTPGANTKKSTTCCICAQAAVGLMKSCQCSNSSCSLRAHSSCIAKQSNRTTGPSVSYPGSTSTPAPPTLLCARSTTK